MWPLPFPLPPLSLLFSLGPTNFYSIFGGLKKLGKRESARKANLSGAPFSPPLLCIPNWMGGGRKKKRRKRKRKELLLFFGFRFRGLYSKEFFRLFWEGHCCVPRKLFGPIVGPVWCGGKRLLCIAWVKLFRQSRNRNQIARWFPKKCYSNCFFFFVNLYRT